MIHQQGDLAGIIQEAVDSATPVKMRKIEKSSSLAEFVRKRKMKRSTGKTKILQSDEISRSERFVAMNLGFLRTNLVMIHEKLGDAATISLIHQMANMCLPHLQAATGSNIQYEVVINQEET